LLNNRTLLIFLKMPTIESIKVWIQRESSRFVDVEHIAFKTAGLEYILNNVLPHIANTASVNVMVFDITKTRSKHRTIIARYVLESLIKILPMETR